MTARLAVFALVLTACSGSDPAPVSDQDTVPRTLQEAKAPDPTPHATPEAPKHGDTPFHLWVSNESSESPDVDIDVYIDDVLSVTGTFHHKEYISFEGFELKVEKGNHTIRAVTKAGAIEKTTTFEIPAERWANISFYRDDVSGKQITAQIYDVPTFFD